jgi:hypothetical protein
MGRCSRSGRSRCNRRRRRRRRRSAHHRSCHQFLIVVTDDCSAHALARFFLLLLPIGTARTEPSAHRLLLAPLASTDSCTGVAATELKVVVRTLRGCGSSTEQNIHTETTVSATRRQTKGQCAHNKHRAPTRNRREVMTDRRSPHPPPSCSHQVRPWRGASGGSFSKLDGREATERG